MGDIPEEMEDMELVLVRDIERVLGKEAVEKLRENGETKVIPTEVV